MVQITPNVMPVYTYTGNHQMIDDGNGHWRIKFLSSGVLEWLSPDTSIDVFLVGGGAAGVYMKSQYYYNGGGGGYTKTVKQQKLSKNQRIQITVGAGGTPDAWGGAEGGTTKFDSLSAAGGSGASGGSGGGGGDWNSYRRGGHGGTDGANGENGYNDSGSVPGGRGQGSTTREFGEPGAELYSGGGGGGAYGYRNTSSGGSGGSGSPKLATSGRSGSDASYNTWAGGGAGGGYGGGGGGTTKPDAQMGSGAQGIVIIRDARA